MAVTPMTACAAGQGQVQGPVQDPGSLELVVSSRGRKAIDPLTVPAAVAALQAFTMDLFERMVDGDNAVSSPYSVALALAMTSNGARGDTAEEMLDVLRHPDLAELNTGLNSVTQVIASRAGPQLRRDGSTTEIALEVVNSLWGQRDTTWEPVFLDALAGYYGAGMRQVDFKREREREAARAQINQWIADSTQDKITDLISDRDLTDLTRLVLVNAVYLKAPWEQPFRKSATQRQPFTRADGSTVEVDMMSAELHQAEVHAGPGWRAARLRYAGGQLGMAVVLPDPGAQPTLSALLGPDGLGGLLAGLAPGDGLQVQVPRWEFRVNRELNDDLKTMGMPTAFDEVRADMSGMTTDEPLSIAIVIHEAFISVDEEGTEAAAVTVVIAEGISLSAPPPETLVLDRPFFFVLHDIETGTPLFIGTVADPTRS